MRRLLLLLILPVAGCLNYVLPALEMTPPLNVGDAPKDVHVFRVDVTTKSGLLNEVEYSLCEIPHDGPRISPQIKAGVDKGVVGPLFLYREHYHDSMIVRMYRPGFKTVSVTDWASGKQIVWEPVTTVEDREKAIDDLIAPTSDTAEVSASDDADWKAPQGLRSASFSTDHAAALRFVARQYTELAKSKLAEEELIDPNRILDKAQAISRHQARKAPRQPAKDR